MSDTVKKPDPVDAKDARPKELPEHIIHILGVMKGFSEDTPDEFVLFGNANGKVTFGDMKKLLR